MVYQILGSKASSKATSSTCATPPRTVPPMWGSSLWLGLGQELCFSIGDDDHLTRSPDGTSFQEDISENSSTDVFAENEALRSALGECWQRLKDLEAEREGFVSEGVFDLVNTLCHGVKAAGARNERNADSEALPIEFS
ncbi:unnamed protein product [Cladocopium goreaui]|uniref:Uncharacterized protein n=1 Tax=Cladocopium goreaui TaxID=2562237 RepID=A0A9P1C686_9DINO|nr:unnamed protein product [Cladocopium goreaui]